MDTEFCEMINSLGVFHIENGYIIIEFDEFKSMVTYSKSAALNFIKKLNKWHNNYCLKFKISNEFKNFKQDKRYENYKKDLYIWYHCAPYKGFLSVNVYDALITYRKKGKLNSFLILSLITNYNLRYHSIKHINPSIENEINNDIEMENLYFEFASSLDNFHYKTFNSSNSSNNSSSGCGGCSSCGGCGGGGAD